MRTSSDGEAAGPGGSQPRPFPSRSRPPGPGRTIGLRGPSGPDWLGRVDALLVILVGSLTLGVATSFALVVMAVRRLQGARLVTVASAVAAATAALMNLTFALLNTGAVPIT